jgi:hypothetical protein
MLRATAVISAAHCDLSPDPNPGSSSTRLLERNSFAPLPVSIALLRPQCDGLPLTWRLFQATVALDCSNCMHVTSQTTKKSLSSGRINSLLTALWLCGGYKTESTFQIYALYRGPCNTMGTSEMSSLPDVALCVGNRSAAFNLFKLRY